jgi:transcriptional regulator with XRE-family HTH domain
MDETLGARVVRLRRLRGLGQTERGRAVGRSESWGSSIESGKIADLKAPVALRLAEELGTSVAVLTGAATQENTMPSGDTARAALVAASQLPGMPDLTDPANVAGIVAYIEAKSDQRFRAFLASRRAALPTPAYVRGPIRLYAA